MKLEEKLNILKTDIQEDIIESNTRELEVHERLNENAIKKYSFEVKNSIETTKREFKEKKKSLNDRHEYEVQKEKNRLFIETKSKIKEDFINSLKQKLKLLYLDPDGERYLNSKLETLMSEEVEYSTIFIANDSFERDKNIVNKFTSTASILPSEKIKIGGFIAESSNKNFQINATLDFILDKKYDEIQSKFNDILNIKDKED